VRVVTCFPRLILAWFQLELFRGNTQQAGSSSGAGADGVIQLVSPELKRLSQRGLEISKSPTGHSLGFLKDATRQQLRQFWAETLGTDIMSHLAFRMSKNPVLDSKYHYLYPLERRYYGFKVVTTQFDGVTVSEGITKSGVNGRRMFVSESPDQPHTAVLEADTLPVCPAGVDPAFSPSEIPGSLQLLPEKSPQTSAGIDPLGTDDDQPLDLDTLMAKSSGKGRPPLAPIWLHLC
jgi:hypothetical protein